MLRALGFLLSLSEGSRLPTDRLVPGTDLLYKKSSALSGTVRLADRADSGMENWPLVVAPKGPLSRSLPESGIIVSSSSPPKPSSSCMLCRHAMKDVSKNPNVHVSVRHTKETGTAAAKKNRENGKLAKWWKEDLFVDLDLELGNFSRHAPSGLLGSLLERKYPLLCLLVSAEFQGQATVRHAWSTKRQNQETGSRTFT